MSTKIYNGYRMNTLNSYELNQFYLELRGMYKKHMETYFLRQVAKNIEAIMCNLLTREYWLQNAANCDLADVEKQVAFCDNVLKEIYQNAENIIAKFNRADCGNPEPDQEQIKQSLSYDSLFYLACNTIIHRSKRSSVLQVCDSDYESHT